MIKIRTINNIDMFQVGDYNWEILKEYDGSEVYKMVLSHPTRDIALIYGEGNFTVRYFSTLYGGDGDLFIFKTPFNQTPFLVKALIEGEGCKLGPIYHKDTVKLK